VSSDVVRGDRLRSALEVEVKLSLCANAWNINQNRQVI
jgi:hypothetical protein